ISAKGKHRRWGNLTVLEFLLGDEVRRPEHGLVCTCVRPISLPLLRAPPRGSSSLSEFAGPAAVRAALSTASGPTLKEHTMRRLVTLIALPALIAVSLALALANTFTADPLEPVSKPPSPFATCTADHVAQQIGVNFPNSSVEPWVDVNPTNPLNIVAT